LGREGDLLRRFSFERQLSPRIVVMHVGEEAIEITFAATGSPNTVPQFGETVVARDKDCGLSRSGAKRTWPGLADVRALRQQHVLANGTAALARAWELKKLAGRLRELARRIDGSRIELLWAFPDASLPVGMRRRLIVRGRASRVLAPLLDDC
jgi:hypothetical protein